MAGTCAVGRAGEFEDDPVIRASEIGQYAFCRRAWWLGTVLGYASANQSALTLGSQAHAQHGRRLASGEAWRRLAYALWLVGLALVIGYGVYRLAGGPG
jgi:hypothetical protein